MGTLSDDVLDLIFRKARTHNTWLPKPVPDDLLRRLYELGGSAINGSYYSNHYSSEDPSPRVQNFIVHYRERFGEVPDSLAALGYDAAKVAVDAMRRAPDLSGPSVRDAIAQTKDFPGVAGTISLDANRNAIKPAVVLKVEDGKSHYVTTISP